MGGDVVVAEGTLGDHIRFAEPLFDVTHRNCFEALGPKKGMPGVTTFPGNSRTIAGTGLQSVFHVEHSGQDFYSTLMSESASDAACYWSQPPAQPRHHVPHLAVEDSCIARRATLPIRHVFPAEDRFHSRKFFCVALFTFLISACG